VRPWEVRRAEGGTTGGSDLEATDPFQPLGAAIVAVTGEARGEGREGEGKEA